ncbi:iron(III) transport system substrate-binding protein [Bradyrhizobium japonicum]|jgi:iron(III) transport system substrate-binding protein|uniref:extracellular solute-binding protein n=1 Tax=Bradyrhizobium TaxID=374 RepID=UPI0004B91572|nr:MULTISPECIES: extracellular solute-binding protein [Bradyrhizobium]MBR0945387.1 extracellular solute-binding protein [Bradyrhizobium liaoningense]MBR1028783.1 extracellular solute-binding protein [Bradyrhizobium liaoningense]MBR1063504.1 extracellular solute-binding protein [Bradyrhizobium liaoningense]MDI2070922.1 extracellular solute-binding protein [Bradyrhizobium sp. Mp27]
MAVRHKAIAVLIAAAAACLTATGASRAEEITLYSTREAALVEPVVAAFTEASGVKVKIVFVEDSLVKRLASEGDASPADVLMTIGLDKTTQLSSRGLTQAFTPSRLDQVVPPNLRGNGAQWLALSVRPRVAFVRKDSALASIDYEDLAAPNWRGKLCMRSPLHQNNVALVAAYLVHHGEAATEAWLAGLKANLAHKPDGKDNDVIREIAQGTCKIGIGNTVALAQLGDGREGADWRAWAMEVKAVPSTFKGGGTHVNLTGAAIAQQAPHPALARQFLEFLVTPAAQRIFAAAELEYPVLATAERAPIVAEMGTFIADAISIDQIAAHQQAAISLIKKVGFDE